MRQTRPSQTDARATLAGCDLIKIAKLPGLAIMADKNPSRAITVAQRIEMMCDFLEHPLITQAIENGVPVTMPRSPGSLGFDVPLWVGQGCVGLWAALDAFSERAALPRTACSTCGRHCIVERFAPHAQGSERLILAELDDFRHLYAHNFAGDADAEYFKKPRHVLAPNAAIRLACGAQFNGRQLLLNLADLRFYSKSVRELLERFR
jgi:hypothetical protein